MADWLSEGPAVMMRSDRRHHYYLDQWCLPRDKGLACKSISGVVGIYTVVLHLVKGKKLPVLSKPEENEREERCRRYKHHSLKSPWSWISAVVGIIDLLYLVLWKT